MPRVEILAVGNELLSGDTQDRDAQLLARAVADLGGRTERITVIADDPAAIAAAVREALERGTTLLLVAGGLGPTSDDVTVAAVARALGLELRLDPGARDFVARRYAALAREGIVRDAAMSPPREKMARLPAGARWLPNEVGTAPAPVIERAGAVVVCLPGPPAELGGILRDPLQAILREALGAAAVARASYRLDLTDETDFAPVQDRVQPRHPHAWLKSHAPAFGRGNPERLVVTVAARGGSEAEARSLLIAASGDLERELTAAGIGFRRDAD